MTMTAEITPPLPPKKLTMEEALSSARETRALLAGPGVLSECARVFREQFPDQSAVVVADAKTFPIAARVEKSLQACGIRCIEPFTYSDPKLYAEHHFVEELETSLRHHNAIPIATGSGTINDLVKLAAHRTGRNYMCVATAASMDGYTAFGASITFQGAKQTFNCPAPRAVVADIDIIRRAPEEMTASGYADLLAKVTAGADWILADALEVEAIEPRAWAIVQGGLRDALANPAGARAGETEAIGRLVEGLMLGGFAMQWTKSSRPASGAEHQFSHLWDMEHHTHNGEAPSHGFKVGVATLAVTRFYEQMLELDMAGLDVEQCLAAWPAAEAMEARVRQLFSGTDFLETALVETRAKHIPHAELKTQLEQVKLAWPEITLGLRAQLLPSAEMRRRLDLVGAPTEPEQIGISRGRLRESFIRAYHIRRRFTVLDVALRMAKLEPLLARMFGPGGVWSIDGGTAANAKPL